MSHVLEIRDVWKCFRIPHERRTTVLDHIAGTLSILGGTRYRYEEFWAIKELNLTLDRHQSLGIIGPNGSGKSTLLKLIANIIKPDKGEILTSGTLVPVLELGIGFSGDLTVKENATVYGVIMGISRLEIRRRIDSILEFSGLARFEDALLKNLSTGMQVRLAFSIAVETKADIFLIDEALAVGDQAFKEKCLDRFREFKRQNKSIVLVSHDMELINAFCENALYLQAGEARAYGPSDEITRQYVEASRASAKSNL
jgi:lipopolysaccharide transport system ATP-binding protein